MDGKMMAKKAILHSLKKEMMDMLGEGRGDLKDAFGKKMMKVTVASDSPEGVKKGLSKAEEILSKKMGKEAPSKEEPAGEYECPECEDMGCDACEGEMPESSDSEEEPSEESSEEPEEDSIDSIKAKIEELKKKLSNKME